MMTTGIITPVVIGVGDVVNRSNQLHDAVEPLDLMLQAIQHAIEDTDASETTKAELKSSIDSINVVASWTWSYKDLPGLLAQRLGTDAQHKAYSEHGGHSPGVMFDDAARRISRGAARMAVVVGGECLASLEAFARARKAPQWTEPDLDVPNITSASSVQLAPSLGSTHSIGLPIHVYPLYENGFRAHRGQSIAQNTDESARLYSQFAQVAARNPFAWHYGKLAETEQSIGVPSKRNRIICSPYNLLMTTFNNVNMSAACILTTTEFATRLGIPESKWIYPLGGAGTADSQDFWQRPNFYSSPCISRSLDAALQVSGVKKEDIDFYDFYSCFPIVPKLACHHLELPLIDSPKPITLLGGLTFFGGAGNNYSTHAITALVRRLRQETYRSSNGLVLANGGLLSYQYAVCLSNRRRHDRLPYPKENPLPVVVTDVPIPSVEIQAEGEAVIETYTVEYGRDGKPLRGYIVGRLRTSGHRFLANHGDEITLQQLSTPTIEVIGRHGYVTSAKELGQRRLFSFEPLARL